jgi:1-deoxy-D-xylulose-5-phosphate synthase
MFDPQRYPLLARIGAPAELRSLPEAELPEVARELREYLIEAVAHAGGHFGAGLGVVELTVALHYLYETPDDRIVWDVGHQCYPHKILTGRRDRIHTIKQKDGLAPFPRREESPYDTFGVGHSSTSISAALGMAIANQRKGDPRKIVAVIGDGAMTAGMAYEALNHGGDMQPEPNMLVILNDNQMSISENVGGLTKMLARMMTSPALNRARERGKRLLTRGSAPWRFFKRWEEHWKGMFVPSTLFEEFGFHYFGPIDGHDLPALVHAIRTLRDLSGPQLLHVITTKGKGYGRAENDRIEYHAVGPFDPKIGVVKKGAGKLTYTQVFGDWLCDMAAKDSRLLAITPAMREGSGLVRYSKQYPDRYFDVGIAEQHSVTLAAGMACEGMKPVVAIYSTFLQRAYDQLVHDVALQNLDVLFALDRAGVVGPDGATHAGSFDLTYLRCLPNVVTMAPSDENECRPDAVHRLRARRPGRRALPARLRHRRRPGRRDDRDPDRQGRGAPPRTRHRAARVRRAARRRRGRRRRARRHRRQHALRQTAGRAARARARAHPPGAGHARGQRDRRRRRLRRGRAAGRARRRRADPAHRPTRPLPRARQPRGSAGRVGTRRTRHPGRSPSPLPRAHRAQDRSHRRLSRPDRGG